MKKTALLILFFGLIPMVSASILLDDWVDDMETFKAGAHYFNVQYIESTQNVVFKMDGMGGIMFLGECETKEGIMYCFEEVDYPQIKVRIEYLEPDISIEREFSTVSPSLNEQVIVTVTLKNEGNKEATNVKYIDIYPAGLKVFSSRNAGEWQGNVAIGEEEKFTYTIRADDIISFDSTATLSYQFGGTEKTKKSSAQAISVQKPFTISHELSKEAADKEEIVDYNITITNTGESGSLAIENLQITLPPNLDLVKSSSELKKEDNKLSFKGTLEKKQSKTLLIKIKSSRIGTFAISSLAELKTGGKLFKEELENQLSVGLSYILPILNVTGSVKSNSPYSVYIAVKNYGKDEIKNVTIQVESSLFDAIQEKKNIAAGATSEIFKKTFTSPYSEEDRKHNIKISGSYDSSSGKKYTFEKSAQLTVTAAPKVISIIREFNKEEFYPGDEIKVIVRVKNQKNTAVDSIDLSDIFPKEIRSSLMGDVIGYLDKLGPGEEKKAYSYSVVVPEGYKEEEIEFKTTLNAKVDGELIILKKTDTVKILKGKNPGEVKDGQETITNEIGSPEEELNETEEIIQEDAKEIKELKENIFKRMVNWIKSLFRKKES